jgi:ribonuclease-3
MEGPHGPTLTELLRAPRPNISRTISAFVRQFNAVYGTPASDRWDVSKEDWERYEFLGDRVLNLIIAQTLFTNRDAMMDEGEMTGILSAVVSNRGLDALLRRSAPTTFALLIPPAIGQQNSYGERVTGGAFEAFIGALYCEVGLDDVVFFVNSVMQGALESYNPRNNAIGILQEWYQKRGMPVPDYEPVLSTGPQHRPLHTYRVRTPDGRSFEGSGSSSTEAKQEAARKALEEIGREPDSTIRK